MLGRHPAERPATPADRAVGDIGAAHAGRVSDARRRDLSEHHAGIARAQIGGAVGVRKLDARQVGAVENRSLKRQRRPRFGARRRPVNGLNIASAEIVVGGHSEVFGEAARLVTGSRRFGVGEHDVIADEAHVRAISAVQIVLIARLRRGLVQIEIFVLDTRLVRLRDIVPLQYLAAVPVGTGVVEAGRVVLPRRHAAVDVFPDVLCGEQVDVGAQTGLLEDLVHVPLQLVVADDHRYPHGGAAVRSRRRCPGDAQDGAVSVHGCLLRHYVLQDAFGGVSGHHLDGCSFPQQPDLVLVDARQLRRRLERDAHDDVTGERRPQLPVGDLVAPDVRDAVQQCRRYNGYVDVESGAGRQVRR